MTDTRICDYVPCGLEFEPTHPRQRFCTPTCRANQHYVDHPEKGRDPQPDALRCVAANPLDEVRAQHEESKGRWTIIVREHLNRTLLQTGFVSAEDFDALGIPDEHHNLANAQMGGYVRNGYMEPVTWRRSSKRSRKSGKIWTFRITKKGREELVGLDAGGSSGGRAASVEPGESGSTPVPASRADGNVPPSAAVGAASPEPLTLVGDEVGRERPRSAITDPDLGEAA